MLQLERPQVTLQGDLRQQQERPLFYSKRKTVLELARNGKKRQALADTLLEVKQLLPQLTPDQKGWQLLFEQPAVVSYLERYPQDKTLWEHYFLAFSSVREAVLYWQSQLQSSDETVCHAALAAVREQLELPEEVEINPEQIQYGTFGLAFIVPLETLRELNAYMYRRVNISAEINYNNRGFANASFFLEGPDNNRCPIIAATDEEPKDLETLMLHEYDHLAQQTWLGDLLLLKPLAKLTTFPEFEQKQLEQHMSLETGELEQSAHKLKTYFEFHTAAWHRYIQQEMISIAAETPGRRINTLKLKQRIDRFQISIDSESEMYAANGTSVLTAITNWITTSNFTHEQKSVLWWQFETWVLQYQRGLRSFKNWMLELVNKTEGSSDLIWAKLYTIPPSRLWLLGMERQELYSDAQPRLEAELEGELYGPPKLSKEDQLDLCYATVHRSPLKVGFEREQVVVVAPFLTEVAEELSTTEEVQSILKTYAIEDEINLAARDGYSITPTEFNRIRVAQGARGKYLPKLQEVLQQKTIEYLSDNDSAIMALIDQYLARTLDPIREAGLLQHQFELTAFREELYRQFIRKLCKLVVNAVLPMGEEKWAVQDMLFIRVAAQVLRTDEAVESGVDWV